MFRYLGSFPSDSVPILPNEAFAITNTQPSNMQSEKWTMLADFLGRPSFLKQQYKQMMPQSVQSHPCACGFYTIYAAFHLLKFRPEEITGVQDVNVFSFLGNYM